MAEQLASALLLGLVSALLAAIAPRLVGRLPEPDDVPADKERYSEVARSPRLRLTVPIAAGLLGAGVGARVGLGPDTVLWALLVPVFCVLAFIDWRTRFLPTRIIAPTYVVLVALLLAVSVLPFGDGLDGLSRAAIGWAVVGGVYLLMWLIYPRGIGYGDVRLSGLIGLALGHLGLGEAVVGLYAGFLIGAVGGVLLSRLGVVDKRHYPFGPFMVAGAFVAVLAGRPIMAAMGY
jgi:leader peptidase (prepilin peptidase) / N-methyltransferase